MIKIGEQFIFCYGIIFNLTSCRSGFSLTSFIQMQYVTCINGLSRLTACGFDILTYALVSFFSFFWQPFVSKIKYAYQIEQNLKVLHNTMIYLIYSKVTSNELLHECFVRLSQNWKDEKKTKWNHVNSWKGIGGPCHLFDIIC